LLQSDMERARLVLVANFSRCSVYAIDYSNQKQVHVETINCDKYRNGQTLDTRRCALHLATPMIG